MSWDCYALSDKLKDAHELKPFEMHLNCTLGIDM